MLTTLSSLRKEKTFDKRNGKLYNKKRREQISVLQNLPLKGFKEAA